MKLSVIGYCDTPGAFVVLGEDKSLTVSKDLTGYQVAHAIAAWLSGEEVPPAPEPEAEPVDTEEPKAKRKAK